MPKRNKKLLGGVVLGGVAVVGLALVASRASGSTPPPGSGTYSVEVYDYEGVRISTEGNIVSVSAAIAYLNGIYPSITTGSGNCPGTEGTAGTWDIFNQAGSLVEYGCWSST
jgi:hypothetical protein